mgnify:CR=1 FL=1
MDIKDRIKKISRYFRGMQITSTDDGSQIIYVVVSFPHGWIIDEDLEKKFEVTIGQGTNMDEYYFCTDIDTGEQVIFDAIDYNIERMKEAIERAQLLSKKTGELKALFEDENVSIEELRTLTFNYDKAGIEPIIISKQEDDKNKKKENEISNE